MKCSVFVALAMALAAQSAPTFNLSGRAAAAAAATPAAPPPSSFTSTATPDNKDIQNSLTLDKSQIATGFLNDGQSVQEPGQVKSLTSGNNFINFCAQFKGVPITNGLQITSGSCNPVPMGRIPAKTNMPSAKFAFPINGQNAADANKPFTIKLNIARLETGNFVNAQQNYFSAPQQLNAQGNIVGHSHVVVEQLSSFAQNTPTDPTKFAFFKGLNAGAVNGQLSVDVTAGLPAGTYKVSTINTAANHQPALVPIAQHGSLDDVVYFTVGAAAAAAPPAAAPPAAIPVAVSTPAAAPTGAAAAKGGIATGGAAAAAPAKGAAPPAASAAPAKGAAPANGAAAAAPAKGAAPAAPAKGAAAAAPPAAVPVQINRPADDKKPAAAAPPAAVPVQINRPADDKKPAAAAPPAAVPVQINRPDDKKAAAAPPAAVPVQINRPDDKAAKAAGAAKAAKDNNGKDRRSLPSRAAL